MTREESIKHLEVAKLMLLNPDNQPVSVLYDALSMGVEALKQLEEIEQMINSDVLRYKAICEVIK